MHLLYRHPPLSGMIRRMVTVRPFRIDAAVAPFTAGRGVSDDELASLIDTERARAAARYWLRERTGHFKQQSTDPTVTRRWDRLPYFSFRHDEPITRSPAPRQM